MLLMPNKKKIASIIVAKLDAKPKADYVQKLGEKSETGSYELPEDDDAGGPSVGLEAAMDDFIRAVEKKDAKGAAKAFEAAMVLCEHGEESEEPESEVD